MVRHYDMGLTADAQIAFHGNTLADELVHFLQKLHRVNHHAIGQYRRAAWMQNAAGN